MAAFVSKVNESPFCIGAHTATAGQAYQDGAKVQAALDDVASAPVDDKLTREGQGRRRGNAVGWRLTPADPGRAGSVRRIQHH